MRKPTQKPSENVPAPAWAADWITTPPEEAEPEDAGELAAEAPWPGANVLAALAGGAVAGLTYHLVNRAVKRRRESAASQPPPKAKRKRAAAAQQSARPGARAQARRTSPLGDFIDELGRELHRIEQFVAQSTMPPPAARSPPPPPPDDDDDTDQSQDLEAAKLLQVNVDASAEEIGKAWRRLVRRQMEIGPFHDQPGAGGAAARYISAKNRLMERARRRGSGSVGT